MKKTIFLAAMLAAGAVAAQEPDDQIFGYAETQYGVVLIGRTSCIIGNSDSGRRAQILYNNGRRDDACWGDTTWRGAEVVVVCPMKGPEKKRNGPCSHIEKVLFRHVDSLPRSAF